MKNETTNEPCKEKELIKQVLEEFHIHDSIIRVCTIRAVALNDWGRISLSQGLWPSAIERVEQLFVQWFSKADFPKETEENNNIYLKMEACDPPHEEFGYALFKFRSDEEEQAMHCFANLIVDAVERGLCEGYTPE